MGRPRANSITVATPERILRAAEEVFAAHGFGDAKLADIADIADIRRPSLLHHFKSKDALYQACVQRAFADLAAVLLVAMQSEGDFEARLESLVRDFVAFIDDRPTLARVVLREVIGNDGPGRRLLLEQAVPLITQVEEFLFEAGAGRLRDDLPVRAALMQFITDVLVRAGSGSLRVPFWGLGDHTWRLVRNTFLPERQS